MSEQEKAPERIKQPWESLIEAEAMQFVNAVEHNFMHGLNTSLVHLPNPKDPEQRCIQLDYFINATIGATVRNIVKSANASAEFEDYVVDEVRRKFAYVRDFQAKAEKEGKLVKPVGLVGADGKPVSRG